MIKLKPELSKKNRWWISKHRYYELKHFCLQYKEWKAMYLELSEPYHTSRMAVGNSDPEWSDSTAKMVLKRDYYLTRMRMVEKAAEEADAELSKYLFKGVTTNVGYSYLQTVMDIPCGKDMYYDRYRKFFWILDTKLRKYFDSYNEGV